MNYRKFKREAMCHQCRECINRSYGMALERQDCLYLPYPETCSSCGQIRNIVADISRRNRWKLWLKFKIDAKREGRN